MPDIEFFDFHFHFWQAEGVAPTRQWLDSGQVSGILCCTELTCPHEQFEAVNRDLLDLSTRLGKSKLPLLAMVHLNKPDWQEHAAKWFDRWPTLVGIKLHPPVSKYKLTPQLLDPLFDFVLGRKICIASHTTPICGWSAGDFHDSLMRHPETPLVIYHGSPHEESAYLAEAFKNVYVEPSWLGFFPNLFELMRKLGGWRKMLGGTDGPGWFSAVSGSPYDDMVKLARKQIPDEASVRDFCANNAHRFLELLR